ncbi:MAG: c-type cytochrome [Opitutales bacterium]
MTHNNRHFSPAGNARLNLLRLTVASGFLFLSLTSAATAQDDPPEATVLQRFGAPDAPPTRPGPWVEGEFSLDADSVIVFTGQTNTVRHQRDGRLEAALMLGLLEAHESPDVEFLDRLLTADDPRVRAYGTRVVGHWNSAIGPRESLRRLQDSVSDPHPRVRLEAIVAAAAIDHPDSFQITLEAFEHPRDRFIDYALEQNSRALRHHWQPWVESNAAALAEQEPAANEFLQQRLQPSALEHPGRAIYTALCSNCHQPEGRGMAGVYPSLADSPWIDADDPAALIKITLHGLTTTNPEPLSDSANSASDVFPAPMPAMGLTDEQAAAVLSYVREQFSHHENKAEVTPEQVKRVRSKHHDRTDFWTPDELSPRF